MMKSMTEPMDISNMHISIIGGGNMGQAILGGWLASDDEPAAALTSESFTVVDPGANKRAGITEQFGVACVEDALDIPESDIVVLAVKPQVMFDVLEHMQQLAWLKESLVISIAAGISLQHLEEALPHGTAVVRTMPNMPLTIGQGATALCAGTAATPQQLQLACNLFACIGTAYPVEEQLIDVTTAISGSGPAYVAALIEALEGAGVEAGLDAQLAQCLARDTVAGTGALLQQKNQSARDLRIAVSSPKGTTVAALEAMEAQGFTKSIHEGVRAAIARAKELGA